jgi:hypothetical protein
MNVGVGEVELSSTAWLPVGMEHWGIPVLQKDH